MNAMILLCMALAAAAFGTGMYVQAGVGSAAAIIGGVVLFLVLAASQSAFARAQGQSALIDRVSALETSYNVLSHEFRQSSLGSDTDNSKQLKELAARIENLKEFVDTADKLAPLAEAASQVRRIGSETERLGAKFEAFRSQISIEAQEREEEMRSEFMMLETLVKQMAERLAADEETRQRTFELSGNSPARQAASALPKPEPEPEQLLDRTAGSEQARQPEPVPEPPREARRQTVEAPQPPAPEPEAPQRSYPTPASLAPVQPRDLPPRRTPRPEPREEREVEARKEEPAPPPKTESGRPAPEPRVETNAAPEVPREAQDREPDPAPEPEQPPVAASQPVEQPEPELPQFDADQINSLMMEEVRRSIEANKIELYLQPIVMLPQRRVRYYEALTRLKSDNGRVIEPGDYLHFAEDGGYMPVIDNVMLFRSVQVLRRLEQRSNARGVFCNISVHSLLDPEFFAEFVAFMEQNRNLAESMFFEFSQSVIENCGPVEMESLDALAELGFRFSMDKVRNLKTDFQELQERGFRTIKISSDIFLHGMAEAGASIHPADMRSYLERFGMQLIIEKIEDETSLSDVLDYNVKLGQGYLFSEPRPVRPEVFGGKSSAEAA